MRPKRFFAAMLLVAAVRFDNAAKWCTRHAMRLLAS